MRPPPPSQVPERGSHLHDLAHGSDRPGEICVALLGKAPRKESRLAYLARFVTAALLGLVVPVSVAGCWAGAGSLRCLLGPALTTPGVAAPLRPSRDDDGESTTLEAGLIVAGDGRDCATGPNRTAWCGRCDVRPPPACRLADAMRCILTPGDVDAASRSDRLAGLGATGEAATGDTGAVRPASPPSVDVCLCSRASRLRCCLRCRDPCPRLLVGDLLGLASLPVSSVTAGACARFVALITGAVASSSLLEPASASSSSSSSCSDEPPASPLPLDSPPLPLTRLLVLPLDSPPLTRARLPVLPTSVALPGAALPVSGGSTASLNRLRTSRMLRPSRRSSSAASEVVLEELTRPRRLSATDAESTRAGDGLAAGLEDPCRSLVDLGLDG